MSKRFADTEIWKDPWYRKMSLEGKVFWKYLVDNCDQAGFWKKDFESVKFNCGFEVTDKIIDLLNNGKIRIADYGEHVEIVDFVRFQYGGLNTNNNFHRSIKSLQSHFDVKYQIQRLTSPSRGAMEKEKEKEIGGGGVEGEGVDKFEKVKSLNRLKRELIAKKVI